MRTFKKSSFTPLYGREHCTRGGTVTRGKFAIMSYYELWQQSSFLRQNIALRDLLYDINWQVLV